MLTLRISLCSLFTWEDNVPRGTITMKVKDHFLSGESFELVKDPHYEYYKTKPELDIEAIGEYYNTPEYLSHQENSKDVKSFIYNIVKQYMFTRKYKWIARYVNKGNWLDFGAGTGEFLDFLPDKYWEKMAFELNKGAVQKIKNKNIPYIAGYQDTNTRFDVVSAFHAIEHVLDIQAWFTFLKRITKVNAIIAVAVPNYKAYDARYYQEYWAAYDVPRHQYHFSKKSIHQLFRDNGFQLLDEKPMPLDAYYISLISESYRGKKRLFNALKVGSLSNLKALSSKEYSSNLFIFRKLDK